MIKNLSHVSLMSNSLNKVKNFYVKKLGLKIIHEFRNEKNELYGYFLSSNKDTFLEIFKTKKKINFKNKKNNFKNLCFEVSDIKKFNKKIFNNKYKIYRGKTDKIPQFFTKDFEGNTIEFHQRDKISKF